MIADRWRRVEELFADAVVLAPPAREGFLAERCGGDGALREEVERLLAADGDAGEFLEAAVAGGARAWAGEAGRSEIGRRIGPYRLVREIGRGGMSSVYLAERVDDEFRRRVAVKLVRRGMDTRDILDRFLTERQILATLDHPYIAKLHDGGTTDDGLPYFVMEYVEGEPIDAWCDRRRLGVEERLRLFRKVCQAVETAHRSLVVHRDLKPTNVLVTAAGRPKLLDFGIAKLLDPELAGRRAAEPTGLLVRPMTPGYASPEQVRGGAVTTASDVYSLGVLLYELLSGRPPHPLAGPLTAEQERWICEVEPARPSAAVARGPGSECGERSSAEVATDRATRPELLARSLRGDLDTVVLTALAKEPDRRYPSVARLSEDLGRYLAGHPVTARPATVGYRLAKFVRRHRLGVAAAAAMLMALVAAAAALAVQSRRVARERDRANQVAGLLADLFHVADPAEGRAGTITARELLDRGAAQVGALDDQPETQAMLLAQLADLYEPLGLYDQAADLLERVVAIERRLRPEGGVELATRINQLGRVLAAKGDFHGAEPRFAEALDLFGRLRGAESREVTALINNLALVRHDQGDYAGAAPLYRRALAIETKLNGHPHAVTLGNYALLLSDRGEYAEAEEIVRGLVAVTRDRGDDEDLADLLEQLGQIRLARGDLDEAETLLREALKLRRRLFGEEHRDVARSLHSLGALYRERGDLAAAEPLLEAALDQRRRLLGPGHPEYVESLRETAALRAAWGDRAEAEARYRRALAIDTAALGADHPLTGLAHAGLGELLAAEDDCAAAEPELREALRRMPAGDWRRPRAAAALAGCLDEK